MQGSESDTPNRLLDAETLDDLAELESRKHGMVARTIAHMERQLDTLIGRIDAGLAGDDLTCVVEPAHALAGAAASLGLAALARHARTIQQAATLDDARCRRVELGETGRQSLLALRRHFHLPDA